MAFYSRKFNVPPNYSGVAYQEIEDTEDIRSDAEEPAQAIPASATKSRLLQPKGKFRRKKPEILPIPSAKKRGRNKRRSKGGLSILSKNSFTMEDIMLAGLILLLLSNDADIEIVIILGFLLLIGL